MLCLITYISLLLWNLAASSLAVICVLPYGRFCIRYFNFCVFIWNILSAMTKTPCWCQRYIHDFGQRIWKLIINLDFCDFYYSLLSRILQICHRYKKALLKKICHWAVQIGQLGGPPIRRSSPPNWRAQPAPRGFLKVISGLECWFQHSNLT